MTIAITYNRQFGMYEITDDGTHLRYAESYHEAAGIEAAYLEARHSAMAGGDPLLLGAAQIEGCAFSGCVQLRTHEDTGFCCYHNEEETGCRCDCEDDDWIDAAWESSQGTYNGATPQGNICQGCGRTSLTYYCDDCEIIGQIEERRLDQSWRIGKACTTCGDDGDCPDCGTDQRPLLAQCAAVLDACLGGPVIGGGILNELRRVRAALAKQGW